MAANRGLVESTHTIALVHRLSRLRTRRLSTAVLYGDHNVRFTVRLICSIESEPAFAYISDLDMPDTRARGYNGALAVNCGLRVTRVR